MVIPRNSCGGNMAGVVADACNISILIWMLLLLTIMLFHLSRTSKPVILCSTYNLFNRVLFSCPLTVRGYLISFLRIILLLRSFWLYLLSDRTSSLVVP